MDITERHILEGQNDSSNQLYFPFFVICFSIEIADILYDNVSAFMYMKLLLLIEKFKDSIGFCDGLAPKQLSNHYLNLMTPKSGLIWHQYTTMR